MPETSGKHQFGRRRVSAEALSLTIDNRSFSSRKFQPLPKPTGKKPYRLDLGDVLPPEQIAAIQQAKTLVFHIDGDIGGIKDPVPQQLVANGMERDFRNDLAHPESDPAFFYLLGDCVYFNGQASEYFGQFYQPYEHYLAPIFAVPGNHDGDALAPESSLQAFVRNFCQAKPGVITPDAGESTRTAMTQPNVFWTLLTPLVTIVGLYTNVPEGGAVHPDQLNWLIGELKAADKDKPLFVTMHHPILSADDHHSGSKAMEEALTQAESQSGRIPDIIFGGHVHNYQRFTRTRDGRDVPYIVAGAGGYHNLHHVVKVNGQKIVPPVKLGGADAPTLEAYVDSRHGFLRIEVTSDSVQGKYYTVARPQESWSDPPTLADVWELDWRSHKVRANTLPHATVTIDSSISAIREPRLQEGAVSSPSNAANVEAPPGVTKRRKPLSRRR